LNIKLSIRIVSWTIFIIGVVSSISLAFTKVPTSVFSTVKEFSATNFTLGIIGIFISSFIWCIGHFMIKHIENQEDELYYLKELDNKIKEAR
jgi:hypothetical protein